MNGTRWSFAAFAVAGAVALIAPAAGQGKAGVGTLTWSGSPGGAALAFYHFGAHSNGSSVSKGFWLGSSRLTKSGKLTISLTGSSGFSITLDHCTAKSIGRKLSCWVGVTYTALVAGTGSATLRATDGHGAVASLSLSGSCSNDIAVDHVHCWGAGVEAVLPANASAQPYEGAAVESVSCSSAGNCSAGGWYTDNARNQQGLLLTETAGHWSTGVETILPANARATDQYARVDSVSCSSAGNCGAVGSYRDAAGYVQGLLLTETAGHWSAGIEAPLPPNAEDVSLSSISCPSDGNCSAVGVYWDRSNPGGPGIKMGVLLNETAGIWAVGGEVGQIETLKSVSCASAGNCSAVGSYDYPDSSGDGGTAALVLTETNGSWGPGNKTKPQSGDAALSSVSCASAGNCTAVGYTNGRGVVVWCSDDGKFCDSVFLADGLLLTEKAGTWSAEVAPALPAHGLGLNSLNAVSCTSPGNCSAGGSYLDDRTTIDPPFPDQFGLFLTQAGGQWGTGVKEVPQPFDDVMSVSCVSSGNCGAVTYAGYLETQAAGTWGTGVRPPWPANAGGGGGGPWLSSVSCTPDGSCTAAGTYPTGVSNEGLLIGGTAPAVTLDVAMDGAGSGSVSSDRGGIDCGSTCSASFAAGTALTLTATPSPGSRFSGWSGGGCSGTGTCHPNTGITEQTVTATFDPVSS